MTVFKTIKIEFLEIVFSAYREKENHNWKNFLFIKFLSTLWKHIILKTIFWKLIKPNIYDLYNIIIGFKDLVLSANRHNWCILYNGLAKVFAIFG